MPTPREMLDAFADALDDEDLMSLAEHAARLSSGDYRPYHCAACGQAFPAAVAEAAE